MEGAMTRPKPWSNCVPRVELDHRARDARLRLVRIERVLAPRVARRRFQLVRLFAWRLLSEPKVDRTEDSPSSSRKDCMPEIDAGSWRQYGGVRRSPACLPAVITAVWG
jgi:hypothetical protein